MHTQNNLSTEQQATVYCYLTVNQFCEKHKAFKIGGVRSLLFNQSTNGLKEARAVVHIGRKVLINEEKFFGWVEAQNGGK